jgi:DNA polymerase III sliding clamp (beta) subunit (PCNA family)
MFGSKNSQPRALYASKRKLFEIAKLFPDGPVTFQKEENEWVTVECGKSTFRLPGIAKETFPQLPKFNATPFAINASLLTTIIQESRYTLSGAKFEFDKTETRVVMTDTTAR